jgi:hypothetical protein
VLDFRYMKKILKISIASFLALSLSVATVVCCCIGSAVMAHAHKASVCNHCPPQGSSSKHSSNPADSCIYHLTNAEVSYGKIIIAHAPVVFIPATFFDQHIATPFLPSSIQAYPRGSPSFDLPSFTPLYLRTFNLRI